MTCGLELQLLDFRVVTVQEGEISCWLLEETEGVILTPTMALTDPSPIPKLASERMQLSPQAPTSSAPLTAKMIKSAVATASKLAMRSPCVGVRNCRRALGLLRLYEQENRKNCKHISIFRDNSQFSGYQHSLDLGNTKGRIQLIKHTSTAQQLRDELLAV